MIIKELDNIAKILIDFYKPSNVKPGDVPGQVDLSKKDFPEINIRSIRYNNDVVESKQLNNISELESFIHDDFVNMTHVSGFGDSKFLDSLKNSYDIHGLTLDEIINMDHPPKLQELENSTVITLKVISTHPNFYDAAITIIVNKDHLFLFTPTGEDKLFSKLFVRIEKSKGVIRRKSIDYLLFAIMDIVVDSYFPHVDALADSIKRIDEDVFVNKNINVLGDLKNIRKALNIQLENILPLNEIISKLVNKDFELISDESNKYFNHALGHATYICDRINRLKESTSDIMNLSLSMNGHKMNEVMKVLTMMSSIFIPLSFICGLYGMNFDSSKSPYNMPELSMYYGYPIVVSIMVMMVVGMLFYFKKKEWF